MKILHVLHRFVDTDRRGSELYTYHLCKALAKNHEVAVFYSSPTTPPNHMDCGQRDGLKTFVVGSSGSWEDATLRARSRYAETAFAQVLKEWKPNVIHFQHLLFHSFRLPAIARQARVPSVFTLHDFWLLCPQIFLLDHKQRISWPINRRNCYTCCTSRTRRPHSWRRLWGYDPLLLLNAFALRYYLRWGRPRQVARLMQHVDLFVTPSEHVRQRFIHEGIPPTKIVRCGHGLDHALRPPAYEPRQYAGRPLECGFIGSLVPHKGIDVLLDAFQGLKGVNLRVYGRPTPHYPTTRHNGNIRFMGELTDTHKAEAFAQMDVLIVPSICPETFSLVTLESFLFRVPVIASRIGALSELVEDGRNGLLFTPGDAEDLRRKIDYLITNPQCVPRLATQIPPVKSMDDHVTEMETYYNAILARN